MPLVIPAEIPAEIPLVEIPVEIEIPEMSFLIHILHDPKAEPISFGGELYGPSYHREEFQDDWPHD
jgi:hypothetical protein